MNNFLSPLRTEYIDGRGWKVLEDFTYRLGDADGDEFIRVGAGFITDFASIPRALKLLWPSPGGPWDKPAVIHDCLYRERKVYNGKTGTYRLVDKAEADSIFNEGMKVTNTRATARWCIYRGVRLGGFVSWNRYRREEADERRHEENAPPPAT